MNRLAFIFFFACLLCSSTVSAQYTHQDSLRGTNGPGRNWWDIQRYHVQVTPDISGQTISGISMIKIKVLEIPANKKMQIDLQAPMELSAARLPRASNSLPFTREGNIYWIDLSGISFTIGDTITITMPFYGKPRKAVNPPWDGGWIWTKDQKGRDWVSVACQGLGASVWYPCKDFQGDEPDEGASLSIIVPNELTAVANGRLANKSSLPGNKTQWTWEVKNPINTYNLIPYIGYYVNFSETLKGEKGNLDCSYWVLDYNIDKAKKQFQQVPPMMICFENWFGPYPFYEDGYKLVESPHLGMEHQSAVAYGNKYKNGYMGNDLSGTGKGLDWDYIIIHESGHEWFGNNITTKDIADMWVHEGFTMYSEVLYIEYLHDKKAADIYCQGIRANIENDKPIIGPYGVNKEGSGDMYYKGANMIHTIRSLMGDDAKFKQLLRGLNKDFYHQLVTTQQIEAYISEKAGINLSKVFDQYLRTTKIPVFEYKVENGIFSYRWSNAVKDFDMPALVKIGKTEYRLTMSTEWNSQSFPAGASLKDVVVDANLYVTQKAD